jgi:hypothetical protein
MDYFLSIKKGKRTPKPVQQPRTLLHFSTARWSSAHFIACIPRNAGRKVKFCIARALTWLEPCPAGGGGPLWSCPLHIQVSASSKTGLALLHQCYAAVKTKQ